MNLITKQFNNVPFVFREDGWFNMTKAAKHYGKDTYEFLRLPSTKDYLDALTGIFPGKDLIHVQRGSGTLPGVGTWAHPKLAVFFARWLDVRFAVWCDAMIEDILKGKAKVTITKPAESAVMALPPGPNFSWGICDRDGVPPACPQFPPCTPDETPRQAPRVVFCWTSVDPSRAGGDDQDDPGPAPAEVDQRSKGRPRRPPAPAGA